VLSVVQELLGGVSDELVQIGKELAEAFEKEFGGFTCEDLQQACDEMGGAQTARNRIDRGDL